MIRMVVKGKKKIALLHAEKNGIVNATFEQGCNDGRESILVADDIPVNNDNASRWFVAPEYGFQAPFAPGSLLYYSWDNPKVQSNVQ